jgi:ParB-like chromosome segregation protein Spo0J
MKTISIAVEALKPPPRNVRTHPEYQVAELAKAIERFGQTRPVVIDEINTVLAGNALVEAAKRLALKKLDAYRITGLSADDKTRLMLSDNRIFGLGLDDHGAILEAIRELPDFDIPGFDPEVLKNLTIDTSAVTNIALSDYGVLPQTAVNGALAREIPPGSSEPEEEDDESAAELADDEVVCPHCGHVFVPE